MAKIRAAGKGGFVGSMIHIGPKVSVPLFIMVQKLPPTEKKEWQCNKYIGKPKRSSPPVVLSDETVAAMRYDHEVIGLSSAHIQKKYGVSEGRARQLLGYINRQHIKPAPMPKNILQAESESD